MGRYLRSCENDSDRGFCLDLQMVVSDCNRQRDVRRGLSAVPAGISNSPASASVAGRSQMLAGTRLAAVQGLKGQGWLPISVFNDSSRFLP